MALAAIKPRPRGITVAAALLLTFMAGCASWEPRYPDQRPAPPPNPWPEQGGDRSAPSKRAPIGKYPDDGQPTGPTPPDRPPTQPSQPRARKPAAVALAGQADAELSAGKPDSAASLLERALRIDSRDALLWQQLASVRLAQKRPAQAESLLQKSNALAAGDRQLQARNWRTIAEARKVQGNASGATDARRRAAELEAGG